MAWAFPRNIVLSPEGVVILTSMFLHANLLHLGGNLLYLWIFGNNVEKAMGRFRFILFYLLRGAIGALGYGQFDHAPRCP